MRLYWPQAGLFFASLAILIFMSRLCHVDLTVLPLGKEEVVVELYVSVYNLPPLCVALIRSFIIGCGREPTTTSGPIIPLKRTLQERVVETERCSFCG